jgi:hypothetical protein
MTQLIWMIPAIWAAALVVLVVLLWRLPDSEDPDR